MSYRFVPALDSNIWSILWSQLTLIGKNDLFLAASLLGILLFTPDSRKGPFQPFSLAAVSMLALSIKPTSGFVILAGWVIYITFAAKSESVPRLKTRILPGILIMAPGGLWIIRNVMTQNVLFRPEVLDLSEWSIASNLFNPNFYNFIPPNLYIALADLSTDCPFFHTRNNPQVGRSFRHGIFPVIYLCPCLRIFWVNYGKNPDSLALCDRISGDAVYPSNGNPGSLSLARPLDNSRPEACAALGGSRSSQ